VYSANAYPGNMISTPLERIFGEQGVRIRIRKDSSMPAKRPRKDSREQHPQQRAIHSANTSPQSRVSDQIYDPAKCLFSFLTHHLDTQVDTFVHARSNSLDSSTPRPGHQQQQHPPNSAPIYGQHYGAPAPASDQSRRSVDYRAVPASQERGNHYERPHSPPKRHTSAQSTYQYERPAHSPPKRHTLPQFTYQTSGYQTAPVPINSQNSFSSNLDAKTRVQGSSIGSTCALNK
jgi:hypothetical protein